MLYQQQVQPLYVQEVHQQPALKITGFPVGGIRNTRGVLVRLCVCSVISRKTNNETRGFDVFCSMNLRFVCVLKSETMKVYSGINQEYYFLLDLT